MDILRVFYAPAKAMQNVLEKNKFPWVILIITLLYPNFNTLLNYSATRQLVNEQLQRQFAQTGISMTPDQLDVMLTTAMATTFVTTIVAAVAMWFAFSALLVFIAGFFDNERPFKGIIALVGYANMILVLSSVVSGVLFKLGYKDVDFSLGMFLQHPEYNLAITALFQSFSLFRIWKYVVIGVGLNYCVETPGKAAAITVIMFIIATAVTVVPMMFVPAGMVPAM